MAGSNSTQKAPSPGETKNLEALLIEVACLAGNIRDLTNSIVAVHSCQEEAETCGVTVPGLSVAAREMACKIGWLADTYRLIARGNGHNVNDPQGWLLPSLYQSPDREGISHG